jgi:hypothetical protein
MSYTFDGVNKLCILGIGSSSLDVQDMYSRWKEWVMEDENAKFLPFLDVVGGNVTTGSNQISSYFFVLNGWKIRPREASHTLTVDGILNVDGGGDPFTNTLGNWRVRIVQIVPMQAETITIAGEGGTGTTGPTALEIAAAVRDELSVELTHLSSLQNGLGLDSVQATMLLEIYRLYGLDPTKPLIVSNTTRTVSGGGIVQQIATNQTSTTVTRI